MEQYRNSPKNSKGACDHRYNRRQYQICCYWVWTLSVPYANKTVTEITCHGRDAAYLFDTDVCTVIDIGGQDTKIISIHHGQVINFIMNDKCSAGTGRFLEIMSNTLGITLGEMFALAAQGSGITISSMCTVFAESEVISLIGSGQPKADIAFGIVDSIIHKVCSLCRKHAGTSQQYYLTGGLCNSEYMLRSLSNKLNASDSSSPLGRYAGAVGAALVGKKHK